MMIIYLKNNNTLCVDEFQFRCSIGKNKLKKNKTEGDYSTPIGKYKLLSLYYRKDKIGGIQTKLNKVIIKKNMGWCNDIKNIFYNKPIIIKKNVRHEKMFRQDRKYDLVIVLDYNFKKPILGKGSAIFIHVTNNYKPTAGCIALSKKDMLILLKLITKNTFIKID